MNYRALIGLIAAGLFVGFLVHVCNATERRRMANDAKDAATCAAFESPHQPGDPVILTSPSGEVGVMNRRDIRMIVEDPRGWTLIYPRVGILAVKDGRFRVCNSAASLAP